MPGQLLHGGATYTARMEEVPAACGQPLRAEQPMICLDERPVQLTADIRPPSQARPGKPAWYASLRAELLAAEAVVFNRASTGLYIERLLDRLGLTAQVGPKAVRFPIDEEVLRRIAAGKGREIAFAAMTEVALFRDQGVRLVGPLPEGLQHRTAYAAGLLASTHNDAASRLLAFLGSPPARGVMADAGVQ